MPQVGSYGLSLLPYSGVELISLYDDRRLRLVVVYHQTDQVRVKSTGHLAFFKQALNQWNVADPQFTSSMDRFCSSKETPLAMK